VLILCVCWQALENIGREQDREQDREVVLSNVTNHRDRMTK